MSVSLAMVPLESSSLLSDLVHEPHTLSVEVEVEGDVDLTAVRHAVTVAVARHPMARVTTSPSLVVAQRWNLHDRLSIPVMTGRWDAGTMPAAQWIDIERHPFTVTVMATPQQTTRLHVAVNHAAFDGLGAIRLVRSMLAATTDQHDPLPDVDPLAARDRRATPRNTVERPTRPGPAAVSHLPHGTTRGAWIVERSVPMPVAVEGATINDHVQAATHIVLAQAIGSGAERIRTLMPVNARPAEWATEVVGNHAWLEHIDTVPGDRLSIESAVAAVVEQTALIRGAARPDPMLEFLGSSWMPPLAGRIAFLAGARLRRDSAATGSVSNLGRIAELPRFAGRRVLGVRFSPPCRSPRGFALGVAGYDGQLFLTLRVLQAVAPLATAEAWLDQIVELLPAPRPSAGGSAMGECDGAVAPRLSVPTLHS
jgi:hypothetical protein